MSSKKPAGVYVELDCLMDTRLATLSMIDKQKTADLILDGYHVRRSDEFTGFDREEFNRRYRERNLETLAQSTVTGCVALLNKVGLDIARDLTESPVHDDLHLYINTYPYILDSEELDDLEESLRVWINAPYEFHFLYLDPKDVTVRYVNDKFTILVMYDFSSWLEVHLKEFQYCFLHDVTLFAPRINLGQTPSTEDLAELTKRGMEGVKDEFDLYERIAQVYINLMLIDVTYFSMLGPNFESLYSVNTVKAFGEL